MGPTWGPPGSCRSQMGPCWPHELCFQGIHVFILRYHWVILFVAIFFVEHRSPLEFTKAQPISMMTSSNGNIFHVTAPLCGEIHWSLVNSLHKGPVMRSFEIFFHPYLNKRLSEQSWAWWIETPSCLLWRHCNDVFAGELCSVWQLRENLLYYNWTIFYNSAYYD